MGVRANTRQKILIEMAKCIKSPEYFLETYGYIRHPKHGYIKFNLYEYQKEALKSFKENRFNITLKSRQTGLSTICAGYVTWLIVFHNTKEVAVVANKQDNAQGFIRKVKLILKKLPPWLAPKIISDNKHSIELSNGSKVSAHATTSDAGRSESLSLLIIDEAAAIDESKVIDLWGAAYPTLSAGGAATIISTPKGVGNFYHKMWLAAKNGEDEFHPLIIHWTQHPDYGKNTTWRCKKCGHTQEDGILGETLCPECIKKIENGNPVKKTLYPTSPWYEDMAKHLKSDQLVAQELDMNFLGSGDNVINEEHLERIELDIKPPIRISGFDKKLWIWEEPIPGEEYLIGADVARGDATDNCAAHVIKVGSNEQVAEYYGKIPPDIFAKLLYELGMSYNKALVAIEANSVGFATCLRIQEMEYPNIFYSHKGQFNPNDTKKLEMTSKNKDNMIPGFQTTINTRPLIVTELEEEIRNATFKIYSSRFLDELRTFIWNNGKPQAMFGCNDDLCIAAAIILFIKNTVLKSIVASRELLYLTLQSINNTFDYGDGVLELNKTFNENSKQNRTDWTFRNVRGEDEDLTWLLGKT